MKLKNRNKENTELLIATGFILIAIGFAIMLKTTALHLIISGFIIVGIGIYRFFKKTKGNKK